MIRQSHSGRARGGSIALLAPMLLALVAVSSMLAVAPLGASETVAGGKFLYIVSNNVAPGQNAVIAYVRAEDGALSPHPGSPFLTRGTGVNNATNGKLGPNDNDTPLVISASMRRLFAVNTHTNTIAVFDILEDGALRHVDGSPFDAHGIGPVSLALSGDVLLVANRNEDPQQLKELRGAAHANYVSFRVGSGGRLSFLSEIVLDDGQKNTQVLVSSRDGSIAFGNDFQVDVDFDGEGEVSKLFGAEPQVRGRIHAFRIDERGALTLADTEELVETVDPAPEVPSVPLGLWDHPSEPLLYVGLVTRNQLGVYRYDDGGDLSFVAAVPNSGQDICWLKTNRDGTRLYAVNNLPRAEQGDSGSSVTVFDISGSKAERPVEIGRVVLPLPTGTFINNRATEQPGSAAFQFDIDPDERFLYVISQRIDQTPANRNNEGNILHVLRIGPDGGLRVAGSRHLGPDGVPPDSRPHGVVALDLD